MGDIIDQKAQPQEPPPAYEAGRTAVDAEAGADTGTDIPNRRRGHRFGKVLALLGLSALLLWLSNSGWRTRNVLKAVDRSDLRKRWIDTGSQSLDAEFDLLDLLSIRSQSGSLNVGINPQPADEENPVPAELLIDSHSGSVSVNFATFNAPERDYITSIDSHSGSVDGTILHGRKTSIVSHSGRIDLQLPLHGAGNYKSTLSTTTVSGSQAITLLSSTRHAGKSITEISSVHRARSGSLTVRYPREWEGTIEGGTQSGSIRLHGGDIDIIRRSSHDVFARKGNGNSTLNFHTGSGSVDIYFN
ncbi:hypothetical protein NA57DRAFT_76103 [Rhizodiscina lignyota]|uniref:Adhesin domain-containing protein n=1 Tax=Rhizodiscina lignyota TaxID=1504668 RepID=A0A9P4II43_9PEZI|nr:hypothetical protein NA57DRAFT_76103 [Rhizodiscina lignyota]